MSTFSAVILGLLLAGTWIFSSYRRGRAEADARQKAVNQALQTRLDVNHEVAAATDLAALARSIGLVRPK